MRFTAARLLKQFFKKRDFIFTDLEKAKAEYWRGFLISAGLLVGSLKLIYDYILPTPDVRFDLKMLVSDDFARFVATNGAGGMDHAEQAMYRMYSFDKQRLREIKTYSDSVFSGQRQ